MSRRTVAFLIASAVFVLDRVTKIAIARLVPLWESHQVIPGFFNIIHSENAGAAFSLFIGMASFWRRVFLIGSSAGAAILLVVILWRNRGKDTLSRLLSVGLALILGGAAGNLYDRAIPGTVTDFLEFYIGSFRWPAFNVADSAISIGAALVVLDLILAKRAGVGQAVPPAKAQPPEKS